MRHVVIIAGGSGTRLWPLSRKDRPKQLLRFLPDGRSLLDHAIDRAKALVPNDEACRWICTTEALASHIQETAGIRDDRFILEPLGRDTLNAIGYSAAIIAREDPDAIIAVLPADHVIEPMEQLVAALQRGLDLAESDANSIVTFSIVPDRPATEYGYIERGNESPNQAGAFHVKQYVEKPDRPMAEQYLAAHTFGWSSGMFAFRAQTMLDAIRTFQPESHAGLNRIVEAHLTDKAHSILHETYPMLPKNSIDYAVMEPASRSDTFNVAVIPIDVKWRDVGSWSSLATLLARDAECNQTNSAKDGVHFDRSHNTLVIRDPEAPGKDHTVVTLGCHNLIIIHTPDATFVCSKDLEGEIKSVVDGLPDELK